MIKVPEVVAETYHVSDAGFGFFQLGERDVGELRYLGGGQQALAVLGRGHLQQRVVRRRQVLRHQHHHHCDVISAKHTENVSSQCCNTRGTVYLTSSLAT